MKKIILLLLSLTLILGALTSCGDRRYDEAEVKAAAKKLIEESVMLNDIYWGDGLPYIEDKNTSDGVYYMALDSYHYGLGFKTVSELQSLTAKTFSKGYCQNINATLLSGIADGDKAIILSRYYQKLSSADGKTPEYIMVNSTWEKLLFGEVKYDYESIKVTHSEDETVYVTINATVTLENYEPQTRELRIALVEEADGWKIDSPTYLTYDKTNLNK